MNFAFKLCIRCYIQYSFIILDIPATDVNQSFSVSSKMILFIINTVLLDNVSFLLFSEWKLVLCELFEL